MISKKIWDEFWKMDYDPEKFSEKFKIQDEESDSQDMEETVEENDKGEKKTVLRKIYPGYVFIKMLMTDESWYVVRNCRGVTGFVGPGSKPVPLTDEEIYAYIDGGEPMDKAGAYGVQEWIGFVGVTRLEGSYFNVMGLPVQRLYTELKKMNAI